MRHSRKAFAVCAGALMAMTWFEASWAQKGIRPPKEASPVRKRAILPPGHDAGVLMERESDEERRERLEGAGIASEPTPAPPPPPPPTPTPPPGLAGTFVQEAKSIAESAKNPENGLLVAQVRASVDAASWWHYRKPAGARHIYDFSWGSDLLVGLEGQAIPADGGWAWSTAAGPRFVVYNAGVYVRSDDPWGEKSDVYADVAISELGGVLAGALERKLADVQSLGLGVRAGVLPLRWVRARHYSLLTPPRTSDAVSHFNVSFSGVETELALTYGYARIVEAALFTSVHAAWPWQVRGRAGIRISLLAR